ncbi:hypothetical protein TCAL_01351 [Tigriopus californicus]|uniref:Transmembrane protein 14C n=1 Tax=Tigriopus californicus TaxID=6832 RepID=A0A553PCC3_TIGCA|nr:transmembrane protein 14C-like [Tigriopus californicus]TRY75332.1 hypothetical protein TCAL_01351 [Tigriopus californicus]|eukprot:TCALIF_01351-PA protein Name:"Similar to tmem14c Transmembrane protein 14C (Danio rerio)" AED:0.01 eAED:0.01 QI:0/-1/0/1/-1/1/1/0/113
MTYDFVAIAYSLAVTAGGVLGYVKKGSLMSGMAGVVCGGLLGFGAYQTSQNPNNYYLSLGVAGVMTGVMGSRFLNSGKIMPAGLVAVLSLAMVVRYGLRWANAAKTAPPLRKD